MGKSSVFFGQPIFSQMVGLLSKNKIENRVKEHGSDHYCKRFTTFQHLITMLYGVTSGCNSLRELCGGIVSYGDKISHCQFNYSPKRSTISDANKRRCYAVYEDIYEDLVKDYLPTLSDSHKQLVIDKKFGLTGQAAHVKKTHPFGNTALSKEAFTFLDSLLL